MNIRLRLTLWYTAIFSLILLIFSFAVYTGLTRNLLNSVDNHLQREVGEILGNLEFKEGEHDDEDEYEQYTELGYTPEEGVFWRILDNQGQPIIDIGYFDGASFDSSQLNINTATLEYATLANDTPIRLYTAPFVIEDQGQGVVQVAESYHHIQEVQGQLLFLLGIGIPLTLLASSAGGWFLASSALDPIDRITRAARNISAHDLHKRLNLQLPNDEVGRLAETFDQMLERLEDSFEQQRRFVADASHEMRTPLTILKGDVEVALNRRRSADSYRNTLEMVNLTTDQMIAMVQELLLLARADNNQSLLNVQQLNLAELLMEQTAALMPKALKREIELNLDAPDVLLIEADQVKLNRLFMNLIDNAIKYSNSGDTVAVSAAISGEQVRVAVADSGHGIAPKHLPHLFDRFYRVDKARSRLATNGHSSGTGLGLSIAQWVTQLHHGRVEVESRLGQGTTFTVWLPRQQNETAQK